MFSNFNFKYPLSCQTHVLNLSMSTATVEGDSRIFSLTIFQYELDATPNPDFYHLPLLLLIFNVCLAESKWVPILKSFVWLVWGLNLQPCKGGDQKRSSYPTLHINFILKRKYSKDQKRLKKFFLPDWLSSADIRSAFSWLITSLT